MPHKMLQPSGRKALGMTSATCEKNGANQPPTLVSALPKAKGTRACFRALAGAAGMHSALRPDGLLPN